MSGPAPSPHPFGPAGVPQAPATSLAELRARAVVSTGDADKYGIRAWINSAAKAYEQGDASYASGDLENAYVSYLKGCTIIVEILPKHSQYGTLLSSKDPAYFDLRKRTVEKILLKVEEIAGIIEGQFKSSQNGGGASGRSSFDSNPRSASSSNRPPSQPTTQPTTQSHERYLSALDSLPSPPSSLPSPNRAKISPPNQKSKSQPPIPSTSTKPQNWVVGAPQPPPASTKPASWQPPGSTVIPSLIPVPGSNHLNAAGTPPSSGQAIPTFPLPSLTNNDFPMTLTIMPEQLAKYLTQQQNPPSVLLMDVRPKEEFERGCVRHKYIIQVEPLTLRNNITSVDIESSLIMNPETDKLLFANRNRFDLIVYYDRNSISDNTPSGVNGYAYVSPLKNLKNAIYENEFTKSLPRTPVLLVGGFEAWRAYTKDKGVYVFKEDGGSRGGSAENTQKENVASRGVGGGVVPTTAYVPRMPPGRANTTELPPINRTVTDFFHQQSDGNNVQSMVKPNFGPAAPPITQYNGYQASVPPPAQMNMPIPQPYRPSSVPQPPLIQQRILSDEPMSIDPATAQPNNTVYPGAVSAGVPASAAGTIAAAGATRLSRRNTFIDNPYNGFTSTASTNTLYEPPPPALAPKPSRPVPPPPALGGPAPPQPPPIPPKNHVSNIDPNVGIRPAAGQLPMSPSSFSQLGAVSIGTTGLKNLGNTCFMNSVIQCLSGTTPLARYFLTGSYKHHINKQNPLGTKGVLAEAYANLIRVMWSESYSFVSPVTFREAIGRFAPQFAGSEQQDSQEFLAFLLDGLHEDLNTIMERPSAIPDTEEEEERFEKLPDWEASTLAWQRYLTRNTSIIVSMFQGQFKNMLQCLTCRKTSTTYNTFMYLSLPIPKPGQGRVTLIQCLDKFVREEVLEGTDAWLCPRCKIRRRASKRLTLSRLPDVLLIHLKRFSFNGPFRDKLETMVEFPLRGLDLTPFMPSYFLNGAIKGPNGVVAPNGHSLYDLYAVSNHFGGLNGGHYTAFVRNGYRGQWHNFDDSRFSVLEDERAVVSRAAYTLYYVKSTV